MADMRMRDHNRADLALAGLTLSVAALAASSEIVRWVRGRHRRRTHPAQEVTRTSERLPGS